MAELYYGRGKDGDNKKLIEFLDEVFFWEEDDDREFLELLPKIYKDKYRPAYNNFVVQDENREFRSAIGNFYNDMIVGGEALKTCCIGNVAVGKDYRSMGYMKELMKMSVEDMKQNGTDMAYLGGQRQRYGYFGFESAGVRYVFYFNRQTVKHALHNEPSGLTLEELDGNDIENIHRIKALNERLAVHSVRPDDAYFDILSSWRGKPYVLKGNGSFVGYLVFSHGRDGVQEFDVISPEYLSKAVLCAFENTEKFGLRFPTAPFEIEKIKFFTENCEGMDIGGCEAMLIYNFEKVIRAFLKAKASYEKLCDGETTVLVHGICGDEKLKISLKGNIPSVEKFDGEAEFEFGHHAATRAFFSNYPSDRSVFPPEIQQWFPLPSCLSSSDTM